jgi:hypothetical protein
VQDNACITPVQRRTHLLQIHILSTST